MTIFPTQYTVYVNDNKSAGLLHLLQTNGTRMQKLLMEKC